MAFAGTSTLTLAGSWSVPLTTSSTRRPSGTTSIGRLTASATPSPFAVTWRVWLPTCRTRSRYDTALTSFGFSSTFCTGSPTRSAHGVSLRVNSTVCGRGR
jgi:hypothetical protein